jgi:hypothetical protein
MSNVDGPQPPLPSGPPPANVPYQPPMPPPPPTPYSGAVGGVPAPDIPGPITGWPNTSGAQPAVMIAPPLPLPAPPRVVADPSLPKAFFYALGAAALVGGIWIGIIVAANTIFYYAAILIGVAAAKAAEVACPRPSPQLGAVAAVATLLAMVVTLYFGFWFLMNKELGGGMPMWLGLGNSIELVKIGVKAEPAVGICAAISVVIAAVKAGTSR